MDIRMRFIDFIKYYYGWVELLIMIGVIAYFMILHKGMPLWFDILVSTCFIYKIIVEKIYHFKKFYSKCKLELENIIPQKEVIIDSKKIMEICESQKAKMDE